MKAELQKPPITSRITFSRLCCIKDCARRHKFTHATWFGSICKARSSALIAKRLVTTKGKTLGSLRAKRKRLSSQSYRPTLLREL